MTDRARVERLALSTWSLHRTLGAPPITGPADPPPDRSADPLQQGALSLLDLPEKLRALGFAKLELCHFHLPTRDPAYLAELRGSLADAGITLWQLLIDAGDVTHPEHAERDLAWIEGWIDVAAALGATRARVSAGHAAPTPAALARSRLALTRLATYAAERGVRLMTENWHALLATPEAVDALLDGLDGVGFLIDLSNWGGPSKHADLARIAPHAESCHAAARFEAPYRIDRADYVRALEVCRDAGFSGPYSLIYDGPGDDEWRGLAIEREIVERFL